MLIFIYSFHSFSSFALSFLGEPLCSLLTATVQIQLLASNEKKYIWFLCFIMNSFGVPKDHLSQTITSYQVPKWERGICQTNSCTPVTIFPFSFRISCIPFVVRRIANIYSYSRVGWFVNCERWMLPLQFHSQCGGYCCCENVVYLFNFIVIGMKR